MTIPSSRCLPSTTTARSIFDSHVLWVVREWICLRVCEDSLVVACVCVSDSRPVPFVKHLPPAASTCQTLTKHGHFLCCILSECSTGGSHWIICWTDYRVCAKVTGPLIPARGIRGCVCLITPYKLTLWVAIMYLPWYISPGGIMPGLSLGNI